MSDHRKVYARGFIDGVEAAKSGRETWNRDKNMSSKRLDSIINGLSSIAKKVYDAVPIQSEVPASLICGELHRLGNGPVDIRVVRGCLASLVDDGLIKEPTRGLFIKQPKKQFVHETNNGIEFADTTKQHGINSMSDKKPNEGSNSSALSVLTELSSRASILSSDAKKLADDIGAAATLLAEDIEKNSADAAKLKQLQQLLKSVA